MFPRALYRQGLRKGSAFHLDMGQQGRTTPYPLRWNALFQRVRAQGLASVLLGCMSCF